MHGVDLHGGAAASVPISLLANPVHFSRTPIVHDRPPPAPGARTAEVLRRLLDSPGMELNRLQQNACI
jgi:crotonobetainyl-CoA:carnitine CoA-transferase CaiB-like acyl-CoA transferase